MEAADADLDEQPQTLADKMGHYYQHYPLRACPTEPPPPFTDEMRANLVHAMHQIDSHCIDESAGETWQLKEEILKDTQRRFIPLIRPAFVDQINQLLASCNKRLAAKTALNGDSTHAQRHAHLLIDLFGTWSNIIQDSNEYHFYKENALLLLLPLAQRVHKMSADIYRAFHNDKEIDKLCSIVTSEETNILALDNIINQLTALRGVVNQYHVFLSSTFHSLTVTDSHTFADDHTLANPSAAALMQALDEGSGIATDRLLLVSAEERNCWKELDMAYVSLEGGYLLRAAMSAAQQTDLLSLEDGVYIPRLLEDIFFITNKVIDRSISMNDEQVVFMVGQRCLEFLSPHQEGPLDKVSLAVIVLDRMLYHQCAKRKALSSKVLANLLAKMTGQEPAVSSAPSSSTSTLVTPQKAPREIAKAPPNTATQAEGDWGEALGAASSWLSTWASPYITGDEAGSRLEDDGMASLEYGNTVRTPIVERSGGNLLDMVTSVMSSPPSTKGSASASAIGGMSMEEMLLAALDTSSKPAAGSNRMDRQNAFFNKIDIYSRPQLLWNGMTAHPSSGSNKAAANTEGMAFLFANADDCFDILLSEYSDSLLSDEDMAVYLNSLCSVLAALQGICNTYDAARYPCLRILHQEYSQCIASYEGHLSAAYHQLLCLHWYQHLQRPCHAFCCRAFDISGSDMEEEWNKQALVGILTAYLSAVHLRDMGSRTSTQSGFLGYFSFTSASYAVPDGVFLSEAAWYAYLLEVSALLVTVLYEHCLLTNVFNEWGAMLFQQEVMHAVRYLQGLLQAAEGQVLGQHQQICAKLLLACNLLVVDKPAHAVQYRTAGLMDEGEVKRVLLRRKEFKADAVQALRITQS